MSFHFTFGFLLFLGFYHAFASHQVNKEIECPPWNGELVYFPDAEDCAWYYICTPSGAEHRPCPAGLWWDSTINGCNWQDQVDCMGRKNNAP